MKNFFTAIFFSILATAAKPQSGEKPVSLPYPYVNGTSCFEDGLYFLPCRSSGAESFQWEEYMYATNKWEPIRESAKFSGTKTQTIWVVVKNPPFQHMLRCVLSNSFGVTIGDSILYMARIPPKIRLMPDVESACIGDPFSFTLSVDTVNSFSISNYTWQKNVNNGWVDVGTGRDFEISKMKQADAGGYRCNVSASHCGNVFSNVVELRGADCYSPKIEAHPQSGTYCLGGRATLTTTGKNVEKYEWEMWQDGAWITVNDGPIFTGSKTNRLEIINIQAAQATEYRCRLTNEFGSVASQTAKLSLKQFSFSISPLQTAVCLGGIARFKVDGSNATSFAWQKRNGNTWQNLRGNTNILELTGISLADTGSYRSVVNTECGYITTNIALLDLKEGCSVPRPTTQTIPNAFSPNGDGINDVWVLRFLENRSNATVRVFSRHGVVVFESTDYSKPWDGSSRGKPLPSDVYYYVINTDSGDFNGSVTIFR